MTRFDSEESTEAEHPSQVKLSTGSLLLPEIGGCKFA
jgi:hypothetical protein